MKMNFKTNNVTLVSKSLHIIIFGKKVISLSVNHCL